MTSSKAHRASFKASLSALFNMRTFIHASLSQRWQSLWLIISGTFSSNPIWQTNYTSVASPLPKSSKASTRNLCGLTIALYLSHKWFQHWQNTLLRLNAHSAPQIDCCLTVNQRQPLFVDNLNRSLHTLPDDHKATKSEPSNWEKKTFPSTVMYEC